MTKNTRPTMRTRSPAWLRDLAILASLVAATPALAGTYDLVIEERTVNITGRERMGVLINGQLPGPVLRLNEGEDATIRVTNRLDEETSIHWHGLILPSEQDGVPGVSDGFQGIAPGTTHTYRFPVKQAGTYWFHSHSATQEQKGAYAPIVIEPKKREPFRYDREYIVQLSDWTDEDPDRVIANLKASPGYYNDDKPTLVDLFRDLANAESWAQRRERLGESWAWAGMRMDRTDLADVSGYTFLVNGQPPERAFTALFLPGERVRLRFINSAAMTYFDVRIPGLKMTVVQADGNNVAPVPVD
jgi:CopA family copper-resistance protein